MKKSIPFVLLVTFACFASQTLADVATFGKDSFVVVENPSSSSQQISYYKIVNDKIELQDMVLVNYSVDKRITTKKMQIHIKIDELSEETREQKE
jgi:hypothetical protein